VNYKCTAKAARVFATPSFSYSPATR
jgi:hypothetical protein